VSDVGPGGIARLPAHLEARKLSAAVLVLVVSTLLGVQQAFLLMALSR
jgi:hypothetical protein